MHKESIRSAQGVHKESVEWARSGHGVCGVHKECARSFDEISPEPVWSPWPVLWRHLCPLHGGSARQTCVFVTYLKKKYSSEGLNPRHLDHHVKPQQKPQPFSHTAFSVTGEQTYLIPPCWKLHSRSSTTTIAKRWNTRIASVPPPAPHLGGLGLPSKCLISFPAPLT